MKKHSIKTIEKDFKSKGYILLSTEYKNNQEPLDFICPKGHQHKMSLVSFQRGIGCSICYGNLKHDINFVKESFEKEKYTLLSTEYKNAYTLLDFICPNGHTHKIKWNDWQQGIRCGKCTNRISKPEKEIQDYIKTHYNGIIKTNDRKTILNPISGRYLELDILLPELRKAIEYNSIYYHRNTLKDNYKQQWCKENGIELLIIDDKEWRKNKNFNKILTFISK